MVPLIDHSLTLVRCEIRLHSLVQALMRAFLVQTKVFP
jgi:hypothetical protein